MRQWNVNPKLMCRQHLLGEHVELHMFAGSIRLGHSITGYVEGGMVELHTLRARHDALSAEMQRRGYKHRSPLRGFRSRKLGRIEQAANERELARRCGGCRELQHERG